MAKEIDKDLKEALDRFNKILKEKQEGRNMVCSPLVFANTVKQSKNGKR